MARKQQEKSQQTREELMKAAEELFSRNGFLNTTVAEITAWAGYAKGSFYSHFESKDQMFLAIVEQKLKAYRNERNERLTRARGFEEAMHIVWDFLESMVQDRNWAKVILEFTISAARDPALRQELRCNDNRLSEAVFAGLMRDYVAPEVDLIKLAALNTVFFEGFLVHNALEIGVLSFSDIREAAVKLIVTMVEPHANEATDDENRNA